MLKIDQPCTEGWNDMSENAKGRFCHKCCKVVMDFTGKTTAEILDVLRSATGRVCGRVNTGQLVPVPVRSSARKRLLLMAAYLVFGALLFTSCRSRRPPPHTMGDVRIFDQYAPGKPGALPGHSPEKG